MHRKKMQTSTKDRPTHRITTNSDHVGVGRETKSSLCEKSQQNVIQQSLHLGLQFGSR